MIQTCMTWKKLVSRGSKFAIEHGVIAPGMTRQPRSNRISLPKHLLSSKELHNLKGIQQSFMSRDNLYQAFVFHPTTALNLKCRTIIVTILKQAKFGQAKQSFWLPAGNYHAQVVTVSYRLGALGFLVSENFDGPGNGGMQLARKVSSRAGLVAGAFVPFLWNFQVELFKSKNSKI